MVYIYALRQGGNVVYVGQSNNVEKRLKQHKKSKHFDNHVILEELETDVLKEILMIEDFYIIKYNPFYNRCLNSSDTYEDLEVFCYQNNLNVREFSLFLKQYRIKPIFANNYSLRDLIVYSQNY